MKTLILFLAFTPLFAQEYLSYVPHFTQKAGEWETRLTLSNPNSTHASLHLYALGETGHSLADRELKLSPNQDLDQSLTELFGPMTEETGWIEIHSDRKKLGGLVVFRNLTTGATTSLKLGESSGTRLILPALENQNTSVSGIALVNTTPVTVDLSYTITDLVTNQTQTKPASLEPFSKFKGTLVDLFGADVPAKASLRVAASSLISGLGLTFVNNLSQIIAVPGELTADPLLDGLTTKVDIVSAEFANVAMSAGIHLQGSDPVVATAGISNRAAGTSLRPEQSSDIGSVTKMFLATLFLKYQEAGMLNLDQKLNVWMPQFPKADQISLLMLLNHTSGIANYTESEAFQAFILEHFGNPSPIDPQILINFALAEGNGGFSFEPGTQWEYSNTGYILLSQISEMVSGEPLVQQLHRRIFDPLQMDQTFLSGYETTPGRAMQYYYSVDDQTFTEVSENISLTFAWGAGAIASTSEDLMTFAKALFGGDLLTQTSLQQMTTPVGAAIGSMEDGISYGLGVIIASFDGEPIWMHPGSTFGGSAYLAWYPNRQANVVNLVNVTNLAEVESELLLQTLGSFFGWEDKAGNKVLAMSELQKKEVSFKLGHILKTAK